MGKTPDGFAPTGPWLVTAERSGRPRPTGDLADPQRPDDAELQHERADLQHPATDRLPDADRHLKPGDLIFTGTPPGVGMARKPPVFLKPGDTMSVTIAGLGTLTNPCTAG